MKTPVSRRSLLPFVLAAVAAWTVTPRGWAAADAPAAPTAASPADAAADRDYAAFQELADFKKQSRPEQPSQWEFMQWMNGYFLKISDAGFAFQEKHPNDPRRWDVLYTTIAHRPDFLKAGVTAEPKSRAEYPVDEAAKAAWEARVAALRKEMDGAANVPVKTSEKLAWFDRVGAFYRRLGAPPVSEENQQAAVAVLHQGLQAHLATYGALAEAPAERAKQYLATVERYAPKALRAECDFVASLPNEAARSAAKGRLATFAILDRPLDIVFTATDGRAVDLKRLHGKVVLVDFWATWCGPCKAELPNVKKVYDAYHDKGFEVVGISLENAQLAETDTPEQRTEKLAKARQALDRFTAAHGMPWPQYCDGKWWKNDVAAVYSIHSIPAMFLVDQDGRIVSTEARGSKLETEVKRLLKI